jgi:hypothetical protein
LVDKGRAAVTQSDEIDLIRALEEIKDEFRPNELAYLAATSKIELPIRDKLAFNLHRQYEAAGFLVARERRRVDIAVVDHDNNAICLVELKAMYTFDALKDPTNYIKKTLADELKASGKANGRTSVYSLLLATHIGESIKRHHMKVFKYSHPVNATFLKHPDGGEAKAVEVVDDSLAGRKVVTKGVFSGGHAFGQRVSVHYWLVKAPGAAIPVPMAPDMG